MPINCIKKFLESSTFIPNCPYDLTFVITLAGIDKENRKMDKLVLAYGIVISIMYIVYLCIVEQANIYRYGIYLIFYILYLCMCII